MNQIDRSEILRLIGALVLSVAAGIPVYLLVEKSLVYVKILATFT